MLRVNLIFTTITFLESVNLYNAGECPIDNCRHCTSPDECSVCDVGRFGKKCEHGCRADSYTCSLCSDSFLKTLKNESVCFGCKAFEYFSNGTCHSCPQTCGSCNASNKCIDCKAGYFGPACQNVCHTNCITCSSHDICISCKAGWVGSMCQCTHNCIKEGDELEWCSINGTCLKGCIDGKRGRMCNDNCTKEEICHKCAQFSERCFECSDGLYGTNNCDQKCGQCLPNRKGVINCSIEIGECNNGCLNGFFGRKCDRNCTYCNRLPENSDVKVCDSDNGTCNNGCVSGYHGKWCDKRCGNCLPDGEGVVKCAIDTGECNVSCVDGFYGRNCDRRCSRNCFTSKSNTSRCDKETGSCTIRCVIGWYGKTCERNCTSTCSNNSCNQFSGKCENGCISGWYGNMCNETCNSSCFKKSCSYQEGHCNHGCADGYFGDSCEHICIGNCKESVCDKQTSLCLFGCTTGYEGTYCNETFQTDFSPVVIGTVSGFAGVLTLSLFVVIICCAVRFVLCAKRCHCLKESAKHNIEPVYAEICENTNEDIMETHFIAENLHLEVDSDSQLESIGECANTATLNRSYDTLSYRKSKTNSYTDLASLLTKTTGDLQTQCINALNLSINPYASYSGYEIPVSVKHNKSVSSAGTSCEYRKTQSSGADLLCSERSSNEQHSVFDVPGAVAVRFTGHKKFRGTAYTSGCILATNEKNSFGTDTNLRHMQTESFSVNENDSYNYLHPVI